MYALQKVGRAVAPNVLAIQKRNANISVIATKPRMRISFVEKIAHGFVFLGIPMILPMFYATQLKVWAAERNASMQ